MFGAKGHEQGNEIDRGDQMMESQGRFRVTMFLALLALVGIAVKFLNIAALHFLRPDVNPVLEPMSNYGVGPHGVLLTVGDIGSGLATLALAVGLYLGIAPPARSYVGLFLLGFTESPSFCLRFSQSMSAKKLQRPAPSTTSSE